MPSRIAGHILDNNRRPVGKVKISVKQKVVAQSENDGFFSLTLARVEPRLALTFVAEGYVTNTRVYESRKNGITTIVIWPIAHRIKFNPASELDIELGSSRLQVPSNALTDLSGKRLSGDVELRYTWFDVTSALQRAAAPGDFTGKLTDGSIRRLNSYGIFDFDLRDLKGRSLSLRRGAKIDLSIPIPQKLIQRAPREVGFFNFDRLTGTWIQIGVFNLAPTTLTYNGSVTSFGGAHNLDDPQDTVCITVQVINYYDSSPMPNMSVTAHGLQYDSQGITDANGFTCLLVQRNAAFSVTAQGSYGNNFWATPPNLQPTFTSPNFSSGSGDCGNSAMCPFVGTVPVDFTVGIGGLQLQ